VPMAAIPTHDQRTDRDDAPGWRLVGAFITIAFGFSWALWLTSGAIAQADPSSGMALDRLATFGPALAAVVLSRRSPVSPGWRIALFVSTASAAVALVIPDLIGAESAVAVVLHLVVVATAGLVVALLPGSRVGEGTLLGGPAPRWTYPVALVAFPLAALGGWALSAVLLPPIPPFDGHVDAGTGVSVMVVFAATLIFGGPLGEEVGWRGWLLPVLLRTRSPLVASLGVGLVWAAWHLPLHLRGLYDQSHGEGWAGVALRFGSSCLLAVLFTALYLVARGSLSVMMLFHASVNNSSGFWLPETPGTTVVLLVAAVLLVVIMRLYRAEGPWPPLARGRTVGTRSKEKAL
jgi:uncharacterized protein